MAKQPVKQNVATLDELPAFKTATLDELPDFGKPIKKKIPTALPSPSGITKPSLGLGQQVEAGPSEFPAPIPNKKTFSPQSQLVSVTPGQSQGELLMAQKNPSTVEDVIEVNKKKYDITSPNFFGGPTTKQQPKVEAPKKVGALEDISNTFMSSINRFASGLAGLPNMAQKAALMMTTKMLGIDDEYNALPVASKKEIDNVMSSIAQRGGVPSANVSRDVQDYFIKKSDEFLENTNKSDKYLNERFGDFFKAPSVEKATDLFLEIPKGFAGSLPYMINPMVGAVSAASEQYDNDIKEANGKLGWGQLVNSGVTGVTEYYIEKISNGILNRSIKSAIGSPEVAKDLAEGFVKSVLKDMGLEFGGEGLTQFIQSLSNDITKGKDIDWVKTANQTIDAALIGGGIAGGMRTTGAGVGYLSKKVMSAVDKKKVDKNTSAIMDLKTKKGPDNAPEVNDVIDSKIKELDDQNKNIINSNIDKVKSLSDRQLQEIVKIDNGITDIYKKRNAVVNDPNLTDEEKQTLIEHLKTQLATLNQQKDAVQKQATSEVPVQPESGTRLQMAEGEPQAEPQVPTQEGQREEIERRRQEELDDTDAYKYDKNFKEFQTYGNTVKEAFDNLLQKATADPTNKELNDLLAYITDRLVPEDIQKGSGKNPLVQEYIDENQQSIKKSSKTGSKVGRINAKYDAELAALEQPTTQEGQTQEEINKERERFGLEPFRPTYRGTSIDEWEDVKNGGKFKSKEGFGDNEAEVTWVSDNKEYSDEYVKSNENGVLIEFKPEAIDKSTTESGQQGDTTGVRLGRGLTLEDVQRVTDAQGNVLYEAEQKTSEQPATQEGKQEKVIFQEVTFDDPLNLYQDKKKAVLNNQDFEFNRLNTKGEENVFTIEKDGEEIGRATLDVDGNYLTNIRIDEKYRRQGLGTAMYDYIESQSNIKLNPSPVKQSEAAENLWKKRKQTQVSSQEGQGQVQAPIEQQIKETFGLNDTQSKAAAIVADKIFGTMAKRAGMSKEEAYKTVQFKKGEPVIEEEKVVTPQATAEEMANIKWVPSSKVPTVLYHGTSDFLQGELQMNREGLNIEREVESGSSKGGWGFYTTPYVQDDRMKEFYLNPNTQDLPSGGTNEPAIKYSNFGGSNPNKGVIYEVKLDPTAKVAYQMDFLVKNPKNITKAEFDNARRLGIDAIYSSGEYVILNPDKIISNKPILSHTGEKLIDVIPIENNKEDIWNYRSVTPENLDSYLEGLLGPGYKKSNSDSKKYYSSDYKKSAEVNTSRIPYFKPVAQTEVGQPTTKQPTQKPAFENVEITETIEPTTPQEKEYVDKQSTQPILWTKIPQRKGDPKIAARNKTIMQAAQDLLDGKITNEQYREIVQKESPIVPIETFFEPATESEVNNALSKDKVGLVNSPTKKGTIFTDNKGDEFQITSDEVGLRLDIPAFINNNTWVVTVHGDVVNTKTGKKTKDKAISYGNVARIKDVKFDFSPTQAIAVATKKQDKVPFLKMRGKVAPIEGATMDEQANNAKKIIEKIKNDPSWTQIGSNPFKHSGFFNRATGQPILSADEVIQIGGLVYAKNAKETTWDNPIFEVKGERGKPNPLDAAGKNVLFQGNKAATQIASDGTAIIYAMTDPNVTSPLHELVHVYQNYLTDAEQKTVTNWAKTSMWSTATSEKFARGFEKYLAEGKAPTKELQSIFDKFKQWLIDIYNGIFGSEIDIELNDDMRRIYDRMLTEGDEVDVKSLPDYDRMMRELSGVVEKSFKRGVPFDKVMDNALQYLSKSRVYEEATDIQREQMVRDVRKTFGKKEKKAPTAKKILGEKPTKTTIVVDEAKEIKKRLKALEEAEQTGKRKGYKEGTTESDKAKKEVLDYVKSLKVNNKISGSQFKAINNALKGNLRNPIVRQRAEERITKIINRANASDLLERAKAFAKSIRTKAKSKTLAANIARMAKNFAKINPSSVNDLDQYMEMANIVNDSIGKPIRNIADVNMVNAYTDARLKEAQDAKNDALMEQYKALVEAGVLSEGMSLKDIQNYILEVEEGKIKEANEKREKEIRDRLDEVFDSLSDMTNTILEDGVNPYTGDEVELSQADRKLLKEFINMDLNKLSINAAYRAQEALMNYIVNGKKFGMEAILAKYQGAENVKIAVDKGLKAADFRWAVGNSWWGSRKWAKEIESIPGLFTWLWRGRTRGLEAMKLMGMDEFMAGVAEGKLKRIKAENEYINKFLKTKPNGKRFNDISNTYQRLIYGYLSRTVDGTTEEKQAEFERRQRILGQVVQALDQSRNKDLIEEGNILGKEFDKVKNAKNIDEIQNKFDKTNEEAVKFISNMFDKDYSFIEDVAEGVYNLILSKDELYTPDMFRSIIEREINVAEAKETVDLPFDLINKKPAGTMMENKRIQNLPGYDVKNNDASGVEKILRLDFDASAFNAYEKALIDAYTAKAVQKYSAFVNSKDFKKLFDNAKDEKLFKEIVNYYINNERGKIGYKSDWKAVQNFSNRLKTFATYRALGSISAIVKQSLSAMVNTLINLSNDPNALKEASKALLFNSPAQEFINKSRSEINLRGAESTADIKSAERLIRNSKYQTLNDVLDVVDKAGRLQMKSLIYGDVPMARASWIGYYVHALKMQGKPYKNIDWSKEKLDKDAMAYANNEVSINQNASMPSTLGRAFSSKNPGTRLIMAYMMPFTSFLFNAKSRLKTDFTVLTSKLATQEDKQAAGRSMVATLTELPAYIIMQTAVNYGLVAMANAFLGYDEDEEDEKLRMKRYSELALTRIVTDLLSPLPNVGDATTVAAFNALLEEMQEEPELEEGEPKKEAFKLFENKPESMIGAMAEIFAQPIASTGRRVADIYTTMDMAIGDTYQTSKGKEIEFSDEDKKMLKIAATMEILGSLNLLPSEAESLARKMVKTIEKRAKEESSMEE